ncbi:cytochrome P450 [Gymnopilus junonius]|uniref:Cytochrome P450 n=1 Tax=Gymnopilus junonius TaxID=109634 RepID=A0A9P5TRJ3_GYMJU|nr:cytochrome P450 [Gymnopilus junonius]
MDNFTEPLMKDVLKKREADLEAGGKALEGEEDTLLEHLVKSTQDPTILKDELVNLLVAGRDTTMSLLSFSLYMLTQHPDIEKRLRQEIFDKMRYMRAFLNGSPPLLSGLRRTPNEAVLLSPKVPGEKPIYVPADTSCIYSVINIHRRTDLWGPDVPYPNPYIFCPFNAGPRICLGQQFAYHEATFYLVRLLQNFTGFVLDEEVNLRPPAEWASANGLKATDKVYIKSHLTMYINVRWPMVRMKSLQSD